MGLARAVRGGPRAAPRSSAAPSPPRVPGQRPTCRCPAGARRPRPASKSSSTKSGLPCAASLSLAGGRAPPAHRARLARSDAPESDAASARRTLRLPAGRMLQQLGAGEADEQDGPTSAGAAEVLDEVEQRGLRPVNVVDQENERAPLGERLEEASERPGDLPAVPDRLEPDRRRTLGSASRPPVLAEQGPHLARASLGRVASSISAAVLTISRDRPERDPLAVGKAAAGEHGGARRRAGRAARRPGATCRPRLAEDRDEPAGALGLGAASNASRSARAPRPGRPAGRRAVARRPGAPA